jgi:hypothetical protein
MDKCVEMQYLLTSYVIKDHEDATEQQVSYLLWKTGPKYQAQDIFVVLRCSQDPVVNAIHKARSSNRYESNVPFARY